MKIPGSPVGYWLSEKIQSAFKKFPRLENISKSRIGMMTTDNVQFIRNWQESSFDKIGLNIIDIETSIRINKNGSHIIKEEITENGMGIMI